MAASNAKVAELLRQYAGVLALEGADRFKTKAYRRAADTIEGLHDDVARLVARGEDLQSLPGVDKAISAVIHDILETGKLPQLDKALSKLGPGIAELANKPALDPKQVARIYKKLKINSLKELGDRLEAGEIRKTLGARAEFHVRHGLDERPRMLLWDAEPLARKIESYLRSVPGVTLVSAAGSLRRNKDTVGDLNFVVAGRTASALFKGFAEFGGVLSSEKRSARETLFKLPSGLGVNLAWTPDDEWGLSLIVRTGSAAHLEDLQTRAGELKLKLAAKALSAKKIDLSDEASIYRALKMQFIEPELREGRGEVQAASDGSLPKLVTIEDLRGDLHMHTTASDGANSMAEMAAAAEARGYRYIAITDHSQSLKITNGLTEKRLLQQIRAIDKLNAKLDGFVVLKSAEVDILEDGRLDYSDAVLKELDLTMCSIHSRFGLNREQQTERIMRAMDNQYFNILGHATGRLLLKREGYELDMDRIVQHARANGCFFEINSSPDRLDLSDEHAKLAKDHGVKIAVNTDAHSIAELNFISAGLNQARRAWLEPADVLNTLPLAKLKKALRR